VFVFYILDSGNVLLAHVAPYDPIQPPWPPSTSKWEQERERDHRIEPLSILKASQNSHLENDYLSCSLVAASQIGAYRLSKLQLCRSIYIRVIYFLEIILETPRYIYAIIPWAIATKQPIENL